MAGNSETLLLKVLADIEKAKRDLAKLQQQADELEEPIKVKADTSSIGAFAQSVRTNMASAEGSMGKVKAAGSTMLDGLAQQGPLALAGAATAVGAFAVKAAAKFVDVSKAAIDMGAAIGTTTEEASRWIAVADDFGIGADQIEVAFGKVAKTLDTGPWDKYGIATRDAGGQARATNDIIIDALGTLSAIPDATERARVGNELFGKGYANLAPLIGKTKDEYREMLGAVEDGQVVTENEARKAERLRLAQDSLSDSLGEVTIAVGEMAAGMAPAIEATSGLIGELTKLSHVDIGAKEAGQDINFLQGSLFFAIDAAERLLQVRRDIQAQEDNTPEGGGGGAGAREATDAERAAATAATALDELNDANRRASEQSRSYTSSIHDNIDALVDFKGATEDGQKALEDFYDSQRAAADSSYKVEKTFDDLIENIQGYGKAVTDADGDTRKLKDIQTDTREAAIKYADAQVQAAEDTAAASGETLDAAASHKTYLGSLLEATAFMDGPQKASMIDYISRVEGIPPEKVTAILADPDNQSIDGASAALDQAARDRTAEINVVLVGVQSGINAALAAMRSNGLVVAGHSAPAPPVAPIGPTQHGAVTVAPASNVTNNITLNTRATSGREVTRELDRWARLNGRQRG